MNYDYLPNPEGVRADFIKAHVKGDVGTKYMWEELREDSLEISFDDAVKKLRNMDTQVWFISEAEGNPSFNNCALEEYEEDKKGFAAVADTDWLAEMIDYEWYNKSNMLFDGFDLGSNDILPDDVYVFDKSYNWFIAFTHEWKGDEPETRYCLAYNIQIDLIYEFF